jgi:pimeloyl-ACP methyl ester carboxylesterase
VSLSRGPAGAAARIDRAFLRLSSGQIHYRTAGAGLDPSGASGRVPLYMAHAGPGSSRGLSAMIGELGRDRWVLAPDMPGNGDSDPPATARTSLAYYVQCAVGTLDALGIAQVDFYGQHTGAHIGCELALAHPSRVRRLVLDGLALFDPALTAQMAAHYAPPIDPDDHGGHLSQVWTFVRDLSLHFPHFLRDPAHRLVRSPVPPPLVRHELAADVFRSLATYHLAYHAVFAHSPRERLPQLAHPTLVLGALEDPLSDYAAAVAEIIPGARLEMVSREQRHRPVAEFLDATLD